MHDNSCPLLTFHENSWFFMTSMTIYSIPDSSWQFIQIYENICRFTKRMIWINPVDLGWKRIFLLKWLSFGALEATNKDLDNFSIFRDAFRCNNSYISQFQFSSLLLEQPYCCSFSRIETLKQSVCGLQVCRAGHCNTQQGWPLHYMTGLATALHNRAGHCTAQQGAHCTTQQGWPLTTQQG